MSENNAAPASAASPGRPPRPPQAPHSPVTPPPSSPHESATSVHQNIPPQQAPQSPVTPPPSSKNEFVTAVQQSYEGGVDAFASQRSIPSPCLVHPSPGLKKPAHNRTVSWGLAAGGSNHTPPRPPPAGGNRSHLPSWDGSTLSGGKGNLNVHDIVNSGGHTELEAETYILQAVEKIAVHQRANTEVSGLYSTIVSQELDANDTFETEEEIEHEDDHSKPRPVPTKQVSHSTLNSATFKAINHNRLKSGTVEGTLFGLTTALEELDDTIERSDSQLDDEAEVPETTFTSADKLANAAQKMMNDGKTNNSNDVEATTPTKGAGKDGKKKKHKRGTNLVVRGAKGASDGVKQEWQVFDTFFRTRKDRMKSYTRRLCVAIVIPSFALAFFLFYVVENPELCPIPKKNRTAAPTMTPTMAPSWAPSSSPSLAPSVSPSHAPTELQDPFVISWFGNETVMLSDTNVTVNVSLAPTNETQAPVEAEEEEEPKVEEESIFDALNFRVCPGNGASASWWILFLGVRQVITFTLSVITQAFVVDYLALSSRVLLNTVGPIFTLLLVQSKGWPFILVFWAIYNLILLCGDKDYHHHWLYWQEVLDIFNDENPSGDVVNNEWNQRIMVNAIIVGVLVAVKRLVLGLFLGRQTFAHYGEKLAEVMKNMVLVGEVATLAKHIENTQEDYQYPQEDYREHMSRQGSVATNFSNGWNARNINRFVQEAEETDDDDEPLAESAADAANAFMANRQVTAKSPDAKSIKSIDALSAASYESVLSPDAEFTESQQKEMAELLDAWEEPQTEEEKEEKKITIGAVLQFRQALAFMKKKYPFLPAFGPADTREACIQSAQQVYDRLLLRTPHLGVLPFETLALLAKKEDGSIDKDKAKEIIRAFRPDRDGTLAKLEWVKSVDVIYKELRLLAANISNSSQMDAAVESLVNIVFYIALGAIIIYRLGENPLDLFLSFSSVILAFAFMFGKSGAKYFDGCLFILVQRPYGVGDRIHLSNPQNETSADGSSGWIVEKVSLFTTSVYWGATNERATLCNGAISCLRVINAARSPNAIVYVDLKFGIETQYEKIEIFRTAVEQFLKDRPREWLTFVGFRPAEVAPEKGFIGYKVIAQHRNSWQAIGGIIESRANLTTYCLEVAKQLEMRFHAPPLPVNLTMKDNDGLAIPVLGESQAEDDAMSGFSASSPISAPGTTDTGLRNRKVIKSRFADLVAKALEASKKDK